MTDPYDEHELSPDPAHEDAWLRDRYPAASADFVDQTLARVMADRQQVTEDAANVEGNSRGLVLHDAVAVACLFMSRE